MDSGWWLALSAVDAHIRIGGMCLTSDVALELFALGGRRVGQSA
jgi:hypothetical protein